MVQLRNAQVHGTGEPEPPVRSSKGIMYYASIGQCKSNDESNEKENWTLKRKLLYAGVKRNPNRCEPEVTVAKGLLGCGAPASTKSVRTCSLGTLNPKPVKKLKIQESTLCKEILPTTSKPNL